MEQNIYQANTENVESVYISSQMETPRESKRKSRILTFLFAMGFGAGQMYQGKMKRGVSIMALSFGIIAISVGLYVSAAAFILPVIWFYAFFDCINKMNYTVEELKMVNDDYIFNIKPSKNESISSLLEKRHLFLGIGLVTVGVYVFLSMIVRSDFLYSLIDEGVYKIIAYIFEFIPRMAIPIIITIIGIKLITGGKSKANESK